jgi:S-adenosylmethionine decarboxylase
MSLPNPVALMPALKPISRQKLLIITRVCTVRICILSVFESNIYLMTVADVVTKVIELFKPGRFTATLFSEKAWIDNWSYDHTPHTSPRVTQVLPIGNAVAGYNRRDKIIYEFENYELIFYHYTRRDCAQ